MATAKKRPATAKTVPYRARLKLSPGDSVRIVREMQEMSQSQLAKATGLSQPVISGIEKGRVALGVERAEKIARALKVHPAVLIWANWDEEEAARRKTG